MKKLWFDGLSFNNSHYNVKKLHDAVALVKSGGVASVTLFKNKGLGILLAKFLEYEAKCQTLAPIQWCVGDGDKEIEKIMVSADYYWGVRDIKGKVYNAP